ncbi:hypothetical protein BJ322DRAFT_603917 [Thelephora terrestris]|uniref:Uncharacterized protein n=1 Tax=Thelephora terrestris TaxID=56493 RepID=A0A9P6HIK2_9AGAM|nr:hypothetical protein BJ322DRAFT_603917 [Thelephora terrestris]
MVWTYWEQDPSRLLDLTLTEFEITHPEGRSNAGRLEPLQTTRYTVKEFRSLGPSRPRPCGNSLVPVNEEIVGKDAIGEKITAYVRARSSEASPLVLFLYDVFWAKNCFPRGSFPEVEEGINTLLYNPPKRYDLGSRSTGGPGLQQPTFNKDRDANRLRDPRRSPPATVQGQKIRRDDGKVYLLDLKPAVESVSVYRDSKRDLYSAAHKFGIQVSEEEKDPVRDSLLIVQLWNLIFSGSPRKVREEELESARKLAQANPELKTSPRTEKTRVPHRFN